MAGDWIKMRSDLAVDPAVIRMAERLEMDEFDVVGRLHAFWAWLDRQSRDGHATGVTHVWLDRYVRRAGFANAMVEVEWLSVGEDGLTIPRFDRHNGETAKTRALNTRNKQKQRSESVPQLSRIEQDNSQTREEKRREEKETQTKRATAIPQPFIPGDSVKRWAAEKFPMLNFDEEVSAFVDYHGSKGSTFKDWNLAVRTWLRNAAKWWRPDGTGNRATATHRRSEARSAAGGTAENQDAARSDDGLDVRPYKPRGNAA